MPRTPLPLNDKLERRSAREKRDERDLLGFLRQPAVRWLSPGLLAKSGVEVVVSGTFGKFADKRELQTREQGDATISEQGEPKLTGAFDYTAAADPVDGLWVDYLSDTGDGWNATYTMAWLLAQSELPIETSGEDGPAGLEHGKILLLGGDQVYPTAEAEAYEDRFIGPFASALPKTYGDVADKRHMFATPGNHDWYDGLVSFLRVFCSDDDDEREGVLTEPRRIGDWVTRQRRSYFALKLPNDWWIWAIDIQLDTYLDSVQLQYFRGLEVAPGDKVILLTAKPAWVKSYERRVEPASWRYLSFFEERVVRVKQARLVLTLTGDTHHYARFEPVDTPDEPTRITAGGGGAYLSATHTLKRDLKLRSLGREKEDTVLYACDEHVYPSSDQSERLRWNILGLALLNPRFAGLVAGLYVALGMGALAALGSGDNTLAGATENGWGSFLTGAAGGLTLLVVALLAGALIAGTDLVKQPFAGNLSAAATFVARLVVGALHAAVHVAIAAAVVRCGLDALGTSAWAVAGILGALGIAGFAFGATVFAIFLLGVHVIRGERAQEAANQVFTGQSIANFKNFVRMHFTPDGGLTLYPLGVDRVCTSWKHVPDQAPLPKFVPAGSKPVAHLIDGPLRFDAAGRRVI